MVTTTRRNSSHLVTFKASEESEAAFNSLTQFCRLSKGEMFVELMDFYKEKCISDDAEFEKRMQANREAMLALIDQARDVCRKQPKRGRPEKDGEAATTEVA